DATHSGRSPTTSQRKPAGHACRPSLGSQRDAHAPVSAPSLVTHMPSRQSSLKRQRAPSARGGLHAPQPAACPGSHTKPLGQLSTPSGSQGVAQTAPSHMELAQSESSSQGAPSEASPG